MAEIEIERRPRRSGWTWFALLLVLAGVAVGAWLVFGGGDGVETETAPAAETTGAPDPLTEPVVPLEPEPGTGSPDTEGASAGDVEPLEPAGQPDGGGAAAPL